MGEDKWIHAGEGLERLARAGSSRTFKQVRNLIMLRL